MTRPRIPDSPAGRIALGALVVGLAIVIAAQALLPGIGAGTIENRLTERGGRADVSLSALPALRLLWGDGDAIGVEADALDLELSPKTGVPFDRLDSFGEVRVAIRDSRIGPVALDEFTLGRDGDEPYELILRGTSSLAELTAAAELPGAGLMGSLLGITDVGNRDLDLDFAMQVASEDGSVNVVGGGGDIGGVPTGPLAEVIVAAVAVQL